MKILHTSDWHIGHTLYAKKRHDEHEQFLAWLKGTICARGIDALIVAGDVFDNGAPGGQAQRLYYDFLTSLLGTCCKTVVVVAGNHDSPTLLEAPAGVLERLNIHTIGLPGEPERHIIPLRNAAGEVGALCVAVPYLRKNELVRLEDDGGEQRSKNRPCYCAVLSGRGGGGASYERDIRRRAHRGHGAPVCGGSAAQRGRRRTRTVCRQSGAGGGRHIPAGDQLCSIGAYPRGAVRGRGETISVTAARRCR